MSGGGGGHKRRHQEEEHEEHENHERWLVSYADMMTLLMVLFIVMFAISQVDSKKFMALKTGLTSGFGAPVAMLSGANALLDVGGSVAPDSVNLAGSAGQAQTQIDPSQSLDPSRSINPAKVAQLATAQQQAAVSAQVTALKAARKQLQAALTKAGMPNGATFRFDERGLVVTIATDKVLFPSASATLQPGGRRILAALAPTLRKLPNRINVDGHTNQLKLLPGTQWPSDWELSGARATGVLRYLVARGIPPTRMAATAFSDTEPLLDPKDPRSVVVNRRVEIVVLAQLDDSAGRALATLGNK